jgi:hypothetical protein
VRFERGIDRAIRRSEAIDREALCVVAGQKVRAPPRLAFCGVLTQLSRSGA